LSCEYCNKYGECISIKGEYCGIKGIKLYDCGIEQKYDLKIRQSYHGNGGVEGYRWKVYDAKGKKLGELRDLSTRCEIGSVVLINKETYIITDIYDSLNPREKRSEVVYYELTRYEYKANVDLGEIIR